MWADKPSSSWEQTSKSYKKSALRRWPQSCGRASLPTYRPCQGGDLFIALRETQEIVRVDAFGRILVRFGGKIAGPAALVRIHDLQASETALTVLDQGYQLKIFDPWGSLLTTSTLPPTMQFCVLGRHNLLYKTPNEWVYIPDSRQPSQKYPLSGLPNDQPTAGYLTSTHFYYAMGRALFVYPLP
jgi:hypothetical protein